MKKRLFPAWFKNRRKSVQFKEPNHGTYVGDGKCCEFNASVGGTNERLNGIQRISKSWAVTDNEAGAEVAMVTMTVHTLTGFRKERIGEFLEKFSKASRSCYLEVEMALNALLPDEADSVDNNPSPKESGS